MNALKLSEEMLVETIRVLCNAKEGIKTNFCDFDYVTSGFKSGELYLLCGEPAAGKTSFAMNLVNNIAVQQDILVLYLSTKENINSFSRKIMHLVARQKIRDTYLQDCSIREVKRLHKCAEKLGKAQVWFKNCIDITHEVIEELAQDNMDACGTKLVIMDCWDLVVSDNDIKNKEEELQKLKELAAENDYAILILARTGVKDNETESDLQYLERFGVDSIEDCFDQIYLIKRNKYESENKKETIEIKIAKNNLGPNCSVELTFDSERCLIENH